MRTTNCVFASVFIMLFLMTFASASFTFSGLSGDLDKDASGSFLFSIQSDKNESVTITMADVVNLDDDSKKINFTINDTSFNILSTETVWVNVNYNVPSDFVFGFEDEYVGELKVEGNVSGSVTNDMNFEVNQNYCDDCTNRADLDIDDIEFDVDDGFGDEDDKEFYPMDEIKVEFVIDNTGNYDLEGIELEICIYDKVAEKCIYDEDDFELSEDDFDLDENDDMTVEAALKIDADDLKAGNTEYKFYISAKGNIDDKDSDYDNEESGFSVYEDITIVTDDEFFLVDNFEVLSPSVNCEENVVISFDLWNIYDDSIDEDDIFLYIYSEELEISEVVEFDSKIKAMDSENVELTFTVPAGLEEGKKYEIVLSIYEDDSLADKYIYENSQDDEAEFSYFIEVMDGCSVMRPAVNAKLIGEATVDDVMEVSVLVTNTDNKAVVYTVSLDGYNSELAEFVAFSSNTISLASGEVQTVGVRFNPVTSGEFTFNVVFTTQSGESFKQPVAVTIAESDGFKLDLEEGVVLYILAGALVLFILFLFVLIMITAKKRKAMKA